MKSPNALFAVRIGNKGGVFWFQMLTCPFLLQTCNNATRPWGNGSRRNDRRRAKICAVQHTTMNPGTD
jgi:hypothetical protein